MKKLRFRWSLSSSKLLALTAFYFSVILNYPFYAKVLSIHPLTHTSADYFIYTMPLVIFVILNAAFQIIAIPVIHKIIMPCLIVISAAISYNTLFFDIYFNREMLQNVVQSNLAEGSRLITWTYLEWLLAFGFVPALLYCLTRVNYHHVVKEVLVRLSMILLSVLLFVGVAAFFYQDYSAFFRNNKSLTHLLVPSNFIGATINVIQDLRAANLPYVKLDLKASQAKTDQDRHVTVLIIGETTRAKNWGLNHYERQTTPLLAKRGEDVINFQHMTSCGTSTAVSVPCMFSSLDRKHFSNVQADHQDNLLDILQRAGIAIKWLNNNSDCKGVCKYIPYQNVTTLNLAEYCRNGECLDNILLTQVDQTLDSTDKDTVLVLHTIGNHGPTYYERYTPEYRQFVPTCDTNQINRCLKQQLVNTYDNGILYVDQFIDQVISKLEQRQHLQSAVIYVSDHGESLGEKGVYLHAAPYVIAPTEQTHIPMIMWFSPRWKASQQVDLTCLRQKAKEEAYSHDHFFSTVFSLMQMSEESETYQQDMDILRRCRIR
ncbi:TPA: phosphoethanolamine transferase [Pasteurella multocida]|nr:phosphoethanolamine--lipid A transferase [Pasteurella multocida]